MKNNLGTVAVGLTLALTLIGWGITYGVLSEKVQMNEATQLVTNKTVNELQQKMVRVETMVEYMYEKMGGKYK